MTRKKYYDYFEIRALNGSRTRRVRHSNARNTDPGTSTKIADGSVQFLYTWARSRQVENREGNHETDGIRSIAGLRVMRGIGTLPASVQLDGVDEKHWPPDIDVLAAPFRTHHYSRLVGIDAAIEHLRRTRQHSLGFSHPITVEAYVTPEWHQPPRGVISTADLAEGDVRGVHCFAIDAWGNLDFSTKAFRFANSWGQEWGDQGVGYLTKEAYDAYVLAAWQCGGIGVTPYIEDAQDIVALAWKVKSEAGPRFGVHGREIVNAESGKRIAWAFARILSDHIELDEFFVWPDERGKGYGKALARLVNELSDEVGKPLHAWVPYNDADPQNAESLRVAMQLLGLQLHPSPDRCAALIGLPMSHVGPPPAPFLPPRGTSTLDTLDPTLSRLALDTSALAEATVYRVWYGTNRKPFNSTGLRAAFTSERDNRTHFGTVDVSIPKSHRFGSIGSHWVRRWLTWTDDRLEVLTSDKRSAAEFWTNLRQDVGSNPGDCVIYLHGFNVDFREAAIRAAQIGYDLKVPGQMAFFSWPSHGVPENYIADSASIEASEQAIANFVADFCEKTAPNRVHLIIHSMGNRGLLRALQRISSGAVGSPGKLFGQIILAAPDLDADLFRSLASLYGEFGDRTTLYASPADKAVGCSQWLHDYPRAGFTPPVTTAPSIDTVVVPGFDLMSLGHSYYAEAEAVLHDMYTLLRSNTAPNDRQRLLAETDAAQQYWRISV